MCAAVPRPLGSGRSADSTGPSPPGDAAAHCPRNVPPVYSGPLNTPPALCGHAWESPAQPRRGPAGIKGPAPGAETWTQPSPTRCSGCLQGPSGAGGWGRHALDGWGRGAGGPSPTPPSNFPGVGAGLRRTPLAPPRWGLGCHPSSPHAPALALPSLSDEEGSPQQRAGGATRLPRAGQGTQHITPLPSPERHPHPVGAWCYRLLAAPRKR